MINFKYAQENINKYKFDYNGYLVIVDKIRTMEILDENNLKNMKKHLKYLLAKYIKEIEIIKEKSDKKISFDLIEKMSKQYLSKKLEYLIEILPAIGFINLGLEKEIGIECMPIKN